VIYQQNVFAPAVKPRDGVVENAELHTLFFGAIALRIAVAAERLPQVFELL